MEFSITVFAVFGRTALLGVEVVLPRLTRQKLATLGSFETFGIGLVGFYRHIEPYILLILRIM